MSKTYTFPAQETLSGQVIVYVTTSTGSGSETLTDKYFSDEIIITDETENLAGELRSKSAELSIAYDKNDLFRSTILPVALQQGEYVRVRIVLDSNPIFIGKIEPSTIQNNPFFAQNDALDGQKTAITFRCTSLLDFLKATSKTTLRESLFSNAVSQSRYVLITSGGVDQYYFYATLRDIVEKSLALLASEYGITYSLTFELTDYTFYSKGDGANNGEYIYPAVTARGSISYGSIGGLAEPSIVLATASPAEGTPIGDITDPSYVGLFSTDDDTFENAYEFFVAILKSLGLYCNTYHSPSVDLFVNIGARSSGQLVTPSDIIDVQELPMVEIARKKVNVTSHQSGNSYVKDFPNLGVSEFSQENQYDFGNDLDFPGLSDPDNAYATVKSLMMPNGSSYFELIRLIGLGDGYLLNPSLASSLDSWTAGGSWTYDASSPFDLGSARVTLTSASGSMPELSQDITSELADGAVFGGMFRTNDNDHLIRFKIYSGATVIDELTVQISPDVNTMLYIHLDVKKRRELKSYPITKVSVGASYFISPNASGYVWFAYSFFQRARKGTPELVGLQIEDLFNDGNLSREQRTLNGYQVMKPSDYYNDNGERFYIKRIRWNLREYETEIESINYPY